MSAQINPWNGNVNIHELIRMLDIEGLDQAKLVELELTARILVTPRSDLGDAPKTVQRISDFVQLSGNEPKKLLHQMGQEKLRMLVNAHSYIPEEHRLAAVYLMQNLPGIYVPSPRVFIAMLDGFDQSRKGSTPITIMAMKFLTAAWSQFRPQTTEQVEQVAEGVKLVPGWDGPFEDGDTEWTFEIALKVAKQRNVPAEEFAGLVSRNQIFTREQFSEAVGVNQTTSLEGAIADLFTRIQNNRPTPETGRSGNERL